MRQRFRPALLSCLWVLAAFGCSARVATDPTQAADLVATVEPAGGEIVIGAPTTFTYRLSNVSQRTVTVCVPPDFRQLDVGPFNERQIATDRPCTKLVILRPGGHTDWSGTTVVERSCDPAAIALYPFLAKSSLCPGRHPLGGSIGLLVGVGCPGFQQCVHVEVPIESTTAVVRSPAA